MAGTLHADAARSPARPDLWQPMQTLAAGTAEIRLGFKAGFARVSRHVLDPTGAQACAECG